MKRLADDECLETQRSAKKLCTDRCASSGSAVTENSSLLTSNSLRPKDGIVEEVHVSNFMTFSSHRFRLALSYVDFDNYLSLGL